ncbi:hypothetical protein L484_007124 [Morus notabilis]|uniref:Uncharacterized protein n=1 Tax=Morus notabilis TaxID=981085 RepID=W9RRF1_9ROSA|nr:hypothetical protein L484_019080 [Morus notabilis]EXC04892.1 hypothetical protein L484_007124 [Morus notabilis]
MTEIRTSSLIVGPIARIHLATCKRHVSTASLVLDDASYPYPTVAFRFLYPRASRSVGSLCAVLTVLPL